MQFELKVILCVWCNFEWVLHLELTPDGYNVNADIYAQQLQQEYDAFKAHYLTLVNWKCALLQHDNVPAQTANVTKHRPEELEGMEVLQWPAYRPNLVISDCHLFEPWLISCTDGYSIMWMSFFASKLAKRCKHLIVLLAQQWPQSIEYNGIYFGK